MAPGSWTSYDLSDFLLFSDRVYWRMLASYNEAMWPAQIVLAVGGAALIAGLLRPGRLQSRLSLLGLAAVWVLIAWAFFGETYQTINWAAVYMVPLFLVQAMLLAIAALWPTPPRLALPAGFIGVIALSVLAVAVFAYPFLAWVTGQAWQSGEVFGLSPDPTAVATLAVTACLRGPVRWLLMIAPLLWCVATGLTLYALGTPHFFVAPALGLAALLATGIASPPLNRPAA